MQSVLERRGEPAAAIRQLKEGPAPWTWRETKRLGGAVLALQGARWLASQLNQRSVPRTRTGGLLGGIAGELGRGLVAGLMGTVAITLAATADQQIRSRLKGDSGEKRPPQDIFQALIGPWLYSADAVGKVLGGVTPANDTAKRRLALAAHLGYGSSWGLSLAALSVAGIRGPAAMGVLLGGVLGAEMLVMPRVGFFPPVGEWGREAVIASTYQHAVYAIAAGVTFDLLEG